MNLFSSNYISRKPIDRAMKKFSARFRANHKVLDIGCGSMPYKKLFTCEYIGLDTEDSLQPDIISNAWDIPLDNESVDGIILNQSLEHIAETQETIQEIHRVLKPGGLVIVTVPHTMKNHSSALPSSQAPIQNFDTNDHPIWRVDYYRFTKYGLMYIFKDFETVQITETSGYFGTMFQLINYFLASIGPNWLFSPVYLMTNVLGLGIDNVFRSFAKLPIALAKKLDEQVYSTLPINYICIFRKR